jgi:hypothetical protein
MSGKYLCLSISLALALAAGAGLGAEGKPDSRVAKQLDRAELKYETTGSGNFSIVQELEGGREQTVYIMSKTETYGALEIREIWTNAGSFEEEPSPESMMELLGDNDIEKIGAWNLEASDDGSYLAYFAIKVPVYLRDKDFLDMLEFAATVGDEMEAKLFDADDN